ncbi:hypothetical protein DIS24_g10962 [Lasiodiplodia hormozganensis]|uniref:Uncharacterized protein n=1 Tax=Lasiodiplodia hormozganensis TaxID=869390 RepID=A0AA40C5S0_9PEZI|nr:hypothetical protein DIS24_g10962 [Lasiodiplodia hormozganensis]
MVPTPKRTSDDRPTATPSGSIHKPKARKHDLSRQTSDEPHAPTKKRKFAELQSEEHRRDQPRVNERHNRRFKDIENRLDRLGRQAQNQRSMIATIERKMNEGALPAMDRKVDEKVYSYVQPLLERVREIGEALGITSGTRRR